MYFNKRKFDLSEAPFLRECAIETLSPFAPMLAPAYVFMRKNKKFISVKAPLDFFTEDELEKLKPYGSLYFSPFVDSSLLFRDVARKIKALLLWQPQGGSSMPKLSPAPYEISDAVLRLLSPLWGTELKIEPFFIAVFSNELCQLLPSEKLLQTRDQNVALLETAILQSAWGVFLALHLGHCQLDFLNSLRGDLFKNSLTHLAPDNSGDDFSDLSRFVSYTIPNSEVKILDWSLFNARDTKLSEKITVRLKRIKEKWITQNQPSPTIFGAEGFRDG